MKIILEQIIENKNTLEIKNIRKEINSDFVPRIGDSIEDWMFLYSEPKREDYKIEKIIIEYEDNTVIAYLEKMYIKDASVLEKIREQIKYRGNDWKIIY